MNIIGKQGFKQIEMTAKIIRADGTEEELGTIGYWHENPLMRLLYRIKQFFRKFHK